MAFLPSRNYKCKIDIPDSYSAEEVASTVLSKCPRNIRNIKLIELIGKGSFGTVHKAEGTINNKNYIFAVKIIKNAKIAKMTKEIEYSYYMSEKGIGPKIYDAFFYEDLYEDPYDPDKDYYEEGEEDEEDKEEGNFIQIIIMEVMDMDCEDALLNPKFDIKRKQSIVKQMLRLVHYQIFELGLICIDMKPTNFVYRIKDNIVKIIDFGEDFCGSNNKDQFNNKELGTIYSAIVLMLYVICAELEVPGSVLNIFRQSHYFPKSFRSQTNMSIILNSLSNLNKVFSWYVFHYSKKIVYSQETIQDIVNLVNLDIYKNIKNSERKNKRKRNNVSSVSRVSSKIVGFKIGDIVFTNTSINNTMKEVKAIVVDKQLEEDCYGDQSFVYGLEYDGYLLDGVQDYQLWSKRRSTRK